MPRKYFSDIVGNLSLCHRLSKDIDEDMLSHAYILEGPKGSGRHTVARLTAAALSCASRNDQGEALPCKKCRNCVKILENKSPDIITVGLEGDRVTLGVEAIRKIKNDMYTAPNDIDIKVYIIENAEAMTVQAQNAFLLSLEEPPEYVLFFLICESSVDLLETIRSRAPVLRTERLDTKSVEDYLLANDKRAIALKNESPEDWRSLLCVSSGSIGYALELLDTKYRKQIFDYRNIAKDIISMLRNKNKISAFEAIAAFGTKRNEICRQLSFIQYALRDLILLKKCDSAPLCFYEDREIALELSYSFTTVSLLSLYNACEKTADRLDQNANVRLSLVGMMQDAGLI